MYIEERHRAILEWLSQHGSISNTDIQKNFDVSYDSAKRDLRILEEKGLLKIIGTEMDDKWRCIAHSPNCSRKT